MKMAIRIQSDMLTLSLITMDEIVDIVDDTIEKLELHNSKTGPKKKGGKKNHSKIDKF
jgi:hypothetical protein